uniref:PWWP domain-containing protein n=1 Tax=Caenorhabditis tropicalis TaxID=1561998 RepID=A0A1I7TEF3_9PELO
MDSSEPSCSTQNFQPNDLIWAKMKGFPPWPAKVLERSEDTPARRIPVMFFGTLETSFMKPNDLSDYLSNRTLYEISRKQKDFNKAVQEIRKAAGTETESDELNFPTIEKKSPPSSPTTGRKRQTSGRFLDAIMAGPDKMRGTRSGSASTKTRSRASSNASATKLLRDMMRKERHRMNSESSHGSKRKLLNNALLNGAPSTSDAFHDYADSTDFNALFGDAILGNFDLNDETKSWKSKRSRGSSKVFDDFFGRTRNRSGSASGRRSRMISLSGFSGVSDMFDELFNNQGDLDSHADQLMLTLNNLPSDGSIDRPLSPEMLNLNPMLQPAVEFCDRCGYECRLINGSWKCNSSHCGTIKTTGGASMAAVRGILEEPLRVPKLEVKTECLSDNSAEKVEAPDILPAKRARKPKRNSDDDESEEEEASKRAKPQKRRKSSGSLASFSHSKSYSSERNSFYTSWSFEFSYFKLSSDS